MLRTHYFSCTLPRSLADSLNAESGRIYSRVLVTHYRAYRGSEVWLSQFDAMKLDDFYGADDARLLHSHSVDAAQEGFYKACKTAKASRHLGAHYPHKRKFYRTTIWKQSGIRVKDGRMLLSLAKGREPVAVSLPANLAGLSADSFLEARLVYDRAGRHYEWHLVVEDGREPNPVPGANAAGVDLGEIHPAAVSDGQETAIFSARGLRSVKQYGHKRRAELQRLQAAKQKGSRAWKRIQRRKTRFAAQQARRTRDIEHKVSRAVVNWAVERGVGTLAIGDVRDIGDGKRLNTKAQQKVSGWSHGKMRTLIEYKAAGAGIAALLQDEAYTSQTCPVCGHREKPTGRVYRCPACGFCGPRDGVGAANICSKFLGGAAGQCRLGSVKYRHPFKAGKSSRLDTAQVAWADFPGRQSQEAAPRLPPA